MICSDVTLQAELRKIFSKLLINGYSDHVIEKTIARKLKDFTSPTSHTVKPCHVMLAKFMPPKRVCLQLENLALITRFDAFLKHPIIFVQLD